ncbi:MAG: DUF523 domain-containing protein [candidate division Zixibacteria bacterium]|nr:DUF523 domain-containing protein [candidate division Zixibacteria bacterium]
MSEDKIVIAVSACLLGHKVRYDGEHRRHEWIANRLAQRVKLLPICPELDAGLSVPREPIDLIGEIGNPRAIGRESETDLTDKLRQSASIRLQKKDIKHFSAFIFKDKSPSCAIRGEKIILKSGRIVRKGTGIFAAELMRRYPQLPVIHAIDLDDDHKRESFMTHVLAYHRQQADSRNR